MVVVASLVLGGLTSFAQTVLPDALRPAANSVSGWVVLTALLVWGVRQSTAVSAVLGAVSLVALVLGYQLVSTLRGFPTTETLFLIAGVVAGPFVGVAAAWLRRRGTPAALAGALLGGIGLGEGVYGLLTLIPVTGWVFWGLLEAAGAGFVLAVLARRTSRFRDRTVGVLVALAITTAFVLAYTAAGSIAA